MSSMFQDAALFNGDISGWRVSNVETMKDMFRDATSFKQTLHGNTWSTSGAIKTGMFKGSSGDISSTIIVGSNDITVPKIRATTFYPGHKILSKEHLKKELTIYLNRSPEGHCMSCPQGAVGGWDVSRVTDMSGLFENAFLFNADISRWDVSRVTDMRRMFKGAKSFECDLSKWDVSRVTDMSQMFSGAKSFKGDALKWKASTQPPEKVCQIIHRSSAQQCKLPSLDKNSRLYGHGCSTNSHRSCGYAA